MLLFRCGKEIYSVTHVNNRVTLDSDIFNTWEKVMDRDNLQAWRKLRPDGSGLYEYKGIYQGQMQNFRKRGSNPRKFG